MNAVNSTEYLRQREMLEMPSKHFRTSSKNLGRGPPKPCYSTTAMSFDQLKILNN